MKCAEEKKERGDVWGTIVFLAHSAIKIWFWGFMGRTYPIGKDPFLCKSTGLFDPFSQKDPFGPRKMSIKWGLSLLVSPHYHIVI